MTFSLLFTSVISAVTETETDAPKIRLDFEDESFSTEQESENLKICTHMKRNRVIFQSGFQNFIQSF